MITETGRKKLSPICITIYFLSLTLLIAACQSPVEKQEAKPQPASVPITPAFILQKEKLASVLTLPGELTAFQQVDIYAKVSSFVKKLYVDVGTEVAAGQLLAVMEAPEINSQLSGAASRLESLEAIYIASKANYERLLETSKTPGTISPNDLDLAMARQKSDHAQLESARAAYKEISDNKNYLEIRAPFGGVISARNVSNGAYVGPAGKGSELPMLVLQEQKHLRLIVAIPEAYTNYLNEKNTVAFTVKALPGQVFAAKVNRLAGALDTRLRSEHIEMDVINADKKLLPGMVAEMVLSLPATDANFVVPRSAIINSTERLSVIQVKDGKAKWVDITKGRQSGEKTEIFGSGLSVGDTLLQAASEEIRGGTQLTIAIK